jgi:hypothetical protein
VAIASSLPRAVACSGGGCSADPAAVSLHTRASSWALPGLLLQHVPGSPVVLYVEKMAQQEKKKTLQTFPHLSQVLNLLCCVKRL